MNAWLEGIMVFLVLTNLAFLASSRLSACIRIVAVQGVVMGFVPLLTGNGQFGPAGFLFAGLTMVLKGLVFPWLLLRALRVAGVRREVEVFVSYPVSVLAGILILLGAFALSSRLPAPRPEVSPLLVSVALATMFSGLFIIVSRVKAITQVLGYLVLENGIGAFGAALLLEEPLLVNLGILLDVFVAVFVMGIAIFHISREFDHMDTHELTSLSDWSEKEEGT